MMVRYIAMLLLAMLLVVGLVAAFFSQNIEQALTMPATQQLSSSSKHTGSANPTKGTATATGAKATATVVQGATTLAQDSFQRANQLHWGLSSDGHSWGGDANASPAFSIAGQAGQVVGSYGQGAQVYSALLGPASQNMDIVATMSANLFDVNVHLDVVLRWSDANNWYKAQVNGSNLTLFKRVKGVVTTLGAVHFPAVGGKAYTMHFRAIGATLYASAWQSDQREPGQWLLVISDTSLLSGQGGVRFSVENTSVIRLSSFRESVASSGI